MKVIMRATREVADVQASYGMRLIEQGKAVACKEQPKAKTAEAPKAGDK